MSNEKENGGNASMHEEHEKDSAPVAAHQGAQEKEVYHPHHPDPVHYDGGKDPRRVSAGHKAAETRHQHEEERKKQEEEERKKQEEAHRRRSEAAKKAAETRKQHKLEEEHRHEVRVEAGRKSWETRRQHEEEAHHHAEAEKEGSHNESHHEKDPVRVEAGKKAASHFDHEHFVELGHMGAEARWHGHEKQEGADESDAHGKQETHAEGHQQHHEKDPVRVEAGKKAASHFDHEHFVELGHMGADARWHGHEKQEGSDASGAGDAHGKQSTEGHHQQHEKDPVRVEAGKKAASHFDHEHFVELGHMGADARWHGHEKQEHGNGAEARHGKHGHDDQSPAEDPKAKNARVEEDANDADSHNAGQRKA